MAVPGFIFGGDTGIKNPEELARARAYAEALLGPQRPAQNVGEGLAVLGQAIRGRREMNAVNSASTAGQASAQSAIAKALGGAGSFPAAPAPGGAPAAPAPSTPYAGDIKSGIQSTAEALGIDPIDLATAISYETAGTFDPAKKGPTTQWGQHKGLIQFGEPQAKQYGVDWQNPVGSQLGPDGAVAKYLTGHGVKPGMGLLDIYSAINAGGVGRYGASDANNGGAPGTVRDKVEKQMGAHRAKALALLGGDQVASNGGSSAIAQALARTNGAVALPQNAPAPQTPVPGAVASIDMPPQPGVTPGAPAAVTPAGQRVVQQMTNPQSMTGGAPMPMQQAQSAPPLPPQAPQPDNVPVMAGGSADAIPKGQLPSMQQLMEASQNPWLNDQQRGIVNMLMKQQLDQADPNNALDAEYKRAQIDALRTPKETAKPAGIQEYEYAKQQGFPGTFQDWEASKKGGMSLQMNPDGTMTFQQGGNIKPMTEGQSKDTTFATRAEGALPLIDQFGDALTSLPETMGGQVPVIGNFAKSKEFQQAEQAGKEFLQAILRKDTGAAITAGETAEYGSVYLPRPGDSPELLAQKKASRARALEALKAGMTPQALLAQEKALAASGGPVPEAPKKRLKFNPATGELE